MQEYYHSTVARFLTNGIDRLYKEAWHPTLNPSGKEQAIRLNNFGQGANNQADDDWVCNGSYLRCNMIQLGYTFNPTLIKKIGLSSLRLYANVNNAFLITSKDYNGYDPDNSSRLGDNKWGANRQFFTYPRPRTFTFGLNVAFYRYKNYKNYETIKSIYICILYVFTFCVAEFMRRFPERRTIGYEII